MSPETLERAFASTRSVLANVRPDQLELRTPCASWDVRALINHFIGASHWYAVSVNAGKSPPPVEADFTAGDMVASYDNGIEEAVAAFGAPDAMTKMIELHFATLPGSAFIALAATDAFVHGWDLARSTGQPSDLDADIATRLLEGARVMLPDALRGGDGDAPFGAQVEPRAAASAADRLAAFLGRAV